MGKQCVFCGKTVHLTQTAEENQRHLCSECELRLENLSPSSSLLAGRIKTVVIIIGIIFILFLIFSGYLAYLPFIIAILLSPDKRLY